MPKWPRSGLAADPESRAVVADRDRDQPVGAEPHGDLDRGCGGVSQGVGDRLLDEQQQTAGHELRDLHLAALRAAGDPGVAALPEPGDKRFEARHERLTAGGQGVQGPHGATQLLDGMVDHPAGSSTRRAGRSRRDARPDLTADEFGHD